MFNHCSRHLKQKIPITLAWKYFGRIFLGYHYNWWFLHGMPCIPVCISVWNENWKMYVNRRKQLYWESPIWELLWNPYVKLYGILNSFLYKIHKCDFQGSQLVLYFLYFLIIFPLLSVEQVKRKLKFTYQNSKLCIVINKDHSTINLQYLNV